MRASTDSSSKRTWSSESKRPAPPFSELVLDEIQHLPVLFDALCGAVDADRHRMGRIVVRKTQRHPT
jgi:hypothetical protein